MLVVKKILTDAGELRNVDSILGPGRFPGGEHGNPLLYFCLENPMTEEPDGLQAIGLQIQM